MAIRGSEELLPHYMAELDYLYTAGREFGRRYGEVAGALEFSSEGSRDPHVQRMIESFAFLTARLQRTYDAQFPEIPAALLNVLYPQLTAPIPSMSVAKFNVDPAQPASLTGIEVAPGTELYAVAPDQQEDLTCRFRTSHAVKLWPIEVVDAGIEPAPDARALRTKEYQTHVRSALRIRLRCQGQVTFKNCRPSTLRFFLPPASQSREAIYELLFTHLWGIAMAAGDAGDEAAALLRTARLEAVGFAMEEALLPCPPGSHQAYRLLQEYFAFPDKFLFFDITGVPAEAWGEARGADLLFLLRTPPRLPLLINAASFDLGCTPIINLFSRISEPVRLDQTQLEYRLTPDSRRQRSTEIHSIERMTRAAARAQPGEVVRPLFSIGHAAAGGEVMYYARRQPVVDPSLEGSEMVVSFVDPNLDPHLPAEDVVFAHVLCTNRGLAEQVDGRTPLHRAIDLPVTSVVCLYRPTRQVAPPRDGAALWRLVSHLSVNHLSLSGDEAGLAALREILLLHCPGEDLPAKRRIAGLAELTIKPVVRQIGAEAWRGFCRGLEITLEYEDSAFPSASAYLLGAVLSRFFGLYVAINSFTELVMRNRAHSETWRWPAQTGGAALL